LCWYHDLDSSAQATWDCGYCEKKGLKIPRNCKGQYGKTAIILSPEKMVDKCPISTLDVPLCGDVYRLIKSTLLAEFSSFRPSELLNELNIYFVYKNVINSAESDYKRTKKDK